MNGHRNRACRYRALAWRTLYRPRRKRRWRWSRRGHRLALFPLGRSQQLGENAVPSPSLDAENAPAASRHPNSHVALPNLAQ